MSSEVPLAEKAEVPVTPAAALPRPVSTPKEFFVPGITSDGARFRPSDWAERLCGVLSAYRPVLAGAERETHLGYSPYARPIMIGDLKCVAVDARLRDLEPMAFDFAMNFARDNDLPVVEACSMPEAAPVRPRAAETKNPK